MSLAQALGPPVGPPPMVSSGAAHSQGCSAQAPAGVHYLVPESTGDLESETLGSSPVKIQLCDLEQVSSHL